MKKNIIKLEITYCRLDYSLLFFLLLLRPVLVISPFRGLESVIFFEFTHTDDLFLLYFFAFRVD